MKISSFWKKRLCRLRLSSEYSSTWILTSSDVFRLCRSFCSCTWSLGCRRMSLMFM